MSLLKQILKHRFPDRIVDVNALVRVCGFASFTSEEQGRLCKIVATEAELDRFITAYRGGDASAEAHLRLLVPQRSLVVPGEPVGVDPLLVPKNPLVMTEEPVGPLTLFFFRLFWRFVGLFRRRPSSF